MTNEMSSVEAMNCVNEHLAAGDVTGAQAIVILIEKQSSILPSSMFERVLRAAVKADCLTDDYSQWCERAYGRRQWPDVLQEALMSAYV